LIVTLRHDNGYGSGVLAGGDELLHCQLAVRFDEFRQRLALADGSETPESYLR
jgi:hypothetical protein